MENHNLQEKDLYVKYDDEIDLIELFKIIWQGKLKIFIFTFLASILSVFFSLSLPNIYTSDAKLASVSSDESSLNNISKQLGGLASFAGVSLGSGQADKTSLGLEVLKSRQFFNTLITNYDFLVPLMASNGWDSETNSLVFNSDIYNAKTKKWTEPIGDTGPSIQEAHQLFLKKINISQDKLTGIINVSIEHYSPFIAKYWLESIIKEINEITRIEDIDKAKRSIKYLNKEIESTKIADVKVGLNNLVENQIEKIMIAQATPEYLFKVIDPPIAPEKKSAPSRAFICILGFLLGGILGMIYVLFNFYFKKYK